MRVILTGGGSGGHIYPAIALIKALKQQDQTIEVLYIGKKGATEERICKKEHIHFKGIQVRFLYRKLIYKNILTVIDFLRACQDVKQIMRDFKPDVVIGTGGYVSSPVMYTAAKLNIKTIIHEQNSVPGLTNKLLAKRVDAVAISFEESRRFFKNKQIVLTGNPRAFEVIHTKKADKSKLGLTKEKQFLLIFFGSLGAKYANLKMAEIIPLIDEMDQLETIFVTGKSHYDDIILKLSNKRLKHVKVTDYLDNMPDYLSVCDLVVGRAGATSISELTALGIPAIYIPSPYVTNNHQEKNAAILSKQRAGILIKESELQADYMIQTIKGLLKDQKLLTSMGENAKKLANISGTKELINLIYNKG